jgi:hypothetical protein
MILQRSCSAAPHLRGSVTDVCIVSNTLSYQDHTPLVTRDRIALGRQEHIITSTATPVHHVTVTPRVVHILVGLFADSVARLATMSIGYLLQETAYNVPITQAHTPDRLHHPRSPTLRLM